eukprot:6188824-Pleurochrysis_carterae.AAC.1
MSLFACPKHCAPQNSRSVFRKAPTDPTASTLDLPISPSPTSSQPPRIGSSGRLRTPGHRGSRSTFRASIKVSSSDALAHPSKPPWL